MAELVLHRLPDHELEAALRRLQPAIAWPSAQLPGGEDIAASVRARLEAGPLPEDGRAAPPRGAGTRDARWWGLLDLRPARRALVLALVALLALVAIAGAVGLGLPGLRLLFGAPPTTPSPTAAAPTPTSAGSPTPAILGGRMALGEALDPGDRPGLDDRAGFHVRWPDDPSVGPPEAAFIDDRKGGQVTLLWPTSEDLPATLEPDVGLLLSQFQGQIADGFFVKAIDGGTRVDPVRVGENAGYWVSGLEHIFWWETASGTIDDPRRWVGDVLLWSDGPITYRLETSLGREEAIRLAESMP